MNTNAINPLPELHPGTPPSMKAPVKLIIRRESERAYLVQIASSDATRTAWVPKSRVSKYHSAQMGSVYRPEVPEGERCRFDVYDFSVPAWLYSKLREQLMES